MENKDHNELQELKFLKKIDEAIHANSEHNDKRYAFKPTEWVVYGMVGSILIAFLAALFKSIGL